VGHARGAVIGSALANILAAAGYEVVREYYFNDAGGQMDRFNLSLLARYEQAHGVDAELPEDGYQGEYMSDLARELKGEVGDRFLGGGTESATELGRLGLGRMIAEIRADMEALRVSYDVWFSEDSLYENGQYEAAMKLLEDRDLLVERDGARWFKSSALSEEPDKVVVRSNGAPTYFATDIAYHYNKFFERKFDRVIDVLGADHQGHVRFMKVLTSALGIADDRLDLLVHQMVTIKSGDEVVKVSKRTGELLTVRELIEEVGVDPCRFFFLSRSTESQMEFDLKLAKEESSENPVYYVQYAHARISSILRLAGERGIDFADGEVSLLIHDAELALVRKMIALPELIEMMARSLEPHHLPHYAVELATAFHMFYQQCRVVSSAPEDIEITRARLKLVEAARVVLARCLGLMLMDAPDQM
jgi:arginyl-tRNA synthetase